MMIVETIFSVLEVMILDAKLWSQGGEADQ